MDNSLYDIAKRIADAAFAAADEVESRHTLAETQAQFAAKILAVAWADMVRRIIPTWPDMPEDRKREFALAAELMRKEQPFFKDYDPICATPGMAAPVCTIGGKNAIAIENLMGDVYPLSVRYMERLHELRAGNETIAEIERGLTNG